jgi:hypothetical protein
MLTFLAGAQSPTKVEVVFSEDLQLNGALTSPLCYVIKAVTGGAAIAVLSATQSGGTPVRRATLVLGAPLKSLEYYSVRVTGILNVNGDPPNPEAVTFQWVDATRPRAGIPLEIPIRDFSGEVTEGLLGAPDGQVFFSPALEASVSSNSTIELQELGVCTRAYDEYHIPNPPDPSVLFTFRPGIPSVLGPTSVLWGDAYRLGQAILNVSQRFSDDVQGSSDFLAGMTLEETIDTSRGGFLNDPRWLLRGSQSFSEVVGRSATLSDTATAQESLMVERITPGFTTTWDTPVTKYFTTMNNLTPVVSPSFYDIAVSDTLEVVDEFDMFDDTFDETFG